MFQNDQEKTNHEDAINRLCQEYADREEFIRDNYMGMLDEYVPQATIRTYLPIIISREVKSLLLKQQN
jgi:hypothetical protein